MLLRQYKRVRRELGKKFHYRDIKKVYTIVLFEKSNSVFKSFSKDIYIHRFQQQSDSGIELNLLQEYTFICLDIFDDIIHNEGRKIDGRLEEWLVFLKEDDPDMIIKLLEQNSEFRDIYEEIYNICRNSERMMGMFSKELEILDRNTVKLMIDELDEALGEEREKVKAIKKGNTESGERITGGGKGTDPVEGRTGKTEKIDEIHSDISCFLFTLRSWSVIITVKTAGRHLFEDFDNRKR